MKKGIHYLMHTLAAAILLITVGCSKSSPSAAPANVVSISLDGAQQTGDSLIVKSILINAKIVEIDMFAYKLGGKGAIAVIGLMFNPSNPAYASGATLSLAKEDAELTYQDISGNVYDDDPFLYPSVSANPIGTITITKNDSTTRRIEGTLAGCVLPLVQGSSGNASVTLDGQFAVTYPAK